MAGRLSQQKKVRERGLNKQKTGEFSNAGQEPLLDLPDWRITANKAPPNRERVHCGVQ